VLKVYAGELRNCASLISRIVLRLKACGDCQHRRSRQTMRACLISAARAAGSIDRCSMSGRLRLGARVDHPAHARTTPGRNPRTECTCQPVASMIAAMVAPCARPSSTSTAACFDPGWMLCSVGFPLHLRSGLRSRARLCSSLSFTLGHALAPLWVTAHYRAATTATPRRHDGAGGGEELRALKTQPSAGGLRCSPLTLCLHKKSSRK